MGSITFGITGDASVGTRTKTFTVPDAHVNRLVARWQAKIATPANPTPSAAQALLAWANQEMEQSAADVLLHERREAGKNLTPISAT